MLSLLPCFTLVKVVYEVCIPRNTLALSLSSAPSSLVLNAKANFRDRAHRKKIMALRTPEVLRMVEMDDDMGCETDVEEPIGEGSDDDLGLEISDEEERLVYIYIGL